MPAVRSSPYAFVAEVARYLAVEPEAVRDAIRSDDLPVTRLMAPTRMVERIHLPSLHAWILERTEHPRPELREYDAFLAEFQAHARKSPAKSPESTHESPT